MKKIPFLERKPYSGDSKLGCLLDAIHPRYIQTKTVLGSGIKEVRHEDIGSYTIEFDKPSNTIEYTVLVNFNVTKIPNEN